MDLADRSGGHRHRIELAEQPLDRLAEALLDYLRDLLVRKRRHVVLEAPELGDDVRRQDVRPHREQLAELDERRAELVEHLPQVAAALGGRLAEDLAVLADEVGELVAAEEVAEAVTDGDLGDLGDASQASRRRLSH